MRGVETGGNGFAHVHLSGEDDAIDRRINCAAGEIDFGVLDRSGTNLDLRVGLSELGECLIEIGLWDEAVLLQGRGAIGIEPS